MMAPPERLKLRRQKAAAASKKETASLSLFMEAFGLEVEEELHTIATQTWAGGVWVSKWCTEQKEAWMNWQRVIVTHPQNESLWMRCYFSIKNGSMRSTKSWGLPAELFKRPCSCRWLSSGHGRKVVSMWLVSVAIGP